jgi:hypothetical protein
VVSIRSKGFNLDIQNNMKTRMFLLFLAICVSLLFGCVSNANSASHNIPVSKTEKSPPKGETLAKSDSASDYCSDLEFMKSNLNELEKPNFEKNGVISPVISAKDFSGYLLSADLIEVCESRIKIGQIIWTIIRGTESDADRKYALQNSKMIVSVLLKIWNNRGFSSDGVHYDKYYLVNYENFNDEDNLLLLTYLLEKKTLNMGLVGSVLDRPLPSLVPLLTEMLKTAETTGDLTEQFYLAIMIEETKKDRSMFRKLNSLANNKKISKENRDIIRSIMDSKKKGHTINLENMENLRLELSDVEENRSSEPDL